MSNTLLFVKTILWLYNYLRVRNLKKLFYVVAILFLNIASADRIAQCEVITQDPIFQSNRSQIEKFEKEKEIADMNKDIEEKIFIEEAAKNDSGNLEDNGLSKSKIQQELFINDINVLGVKSIWRFHINRITKRYKNTYLNLNRIAELRNEIHELYAQKGYITT